MYYRKEFLVVVFVHIFFCLSSQDVKISKIFQEVTPLEKLNLDTNDSSRFFFLGENHKYKYCDQVAIDVFKELIKQKNVKYYYYEGGKAEEYIFNYYLNHKSFKKDKNFNYINTMGKRIRKKFFLPLARVFKENKGLVFKGFDIETDLYNSLSVINYILLNSRSNNVFSSVLNYIEAPSLEQTKKYDQCRFVISSFEKDTSVFFTGLENRDYFYLKEIIKGMKPGIVCDSLEIANKFTDALILREAYISRNLDAAFRDKFRVFIQIGLIHIVKDSHLSSKGFKNVLELNSKIDSSACKIGCAYPNIIETIEVLNFLTAEDLKSLKTYSSNKITYYSLKELKRNHRTNLDYLILCK